MVFSSQEKAQILAQYHFNRSITTTQRWVRRTMRRTPPHRSDILRWEASFRERGTLAHRGGNGRPRYTEETTRQVRELFEREPSTSVRVAATALNLSRSTVQRILRKALSLYPYKLQTLQNLQVGDAQKRLDFAEHVRSQPEGAEGYLAKIVFSDECIFRLNGFVNKQNVRIWGDERPNDVNEHTLHSPSVMVWCAISKDRVIGPYFFENGTVTGELYKNMLSQYAFPRFSRLRPDYIFMQDGAPPHYSNRVRAYLNNKRPGNWIGRGGPVSWPPRSPDLTPCDFFLWGYLKSKVYKTPVESLEDLKTRIQAEIRSISRATLRKVWENTKFRLNFLSGVQGEHIEHTIQ